MASPHRDSLHFEIYIHTAESNRITPGDVGLFLNDFTLLYDLVRLATDSKYQGFYFTPFTLYRGARRLREEDKLYVDSFSFASPLEVIATLSASTLGAGVGFWAYIQALDKISMYRLNREKTILENKKLEIEIEKLRREELQAKLDSTSPFTSFDAVERGLQGLDSITDEEAIRLIEIMEKRLKRSPIQIDDYSARLIQPGRDEPRKLRW